MNIEDLINKYLDKSIIEISIELTKEVEHLDNIFRSKTKPLNIDLYKFDAYRLYAGDFLHFIQTGNVPAGIGLIGLRKFLPIIKNLVLKNQLKVSVLEIFL